MAKKTDQYTAFRDEIAAGDIGTCYILYGEERYLLESCVSELRKKLLPEGDGGFNHRRYGSEPDVYELREAVETFPFFAERTLIEILDYDFSKGLDELLPVLNELPGHVCILFICGEDWKLDRRLSSTKELMKLVRTVEFKLVERERLVPWITRHFRELGCAISKSDAEYLAFLAGGLMTSLRNEIEKLASFSENGVITRGDIEELVTAVPDAVSYKLTDAVAAKNYGQAAQILGELAAMREPPQRIIYAMTLNMRSLLLARHYLDGGKGASELMRAASLRYEFQAKNLVAAARKTTVGECRRAVRLCVDTAYRLNDGGGVESITALITQLASFKAS